MSFNIEEYAQAIDVFVDKMEEVVETQQKSSISDALEPICNVLRIANISVIIREGVFSNVKESESCLFQKGEYDENQVHYFSESFNGNIEIKYCIYLKLGENAWNEEEKKRINVLVKLISSFVHREQRDTKYSNQGYARSAYMFWDENVLQEHEETRKTEKEFSNAINNNEFLVYYQPKVSLKDYSIVGAEALCRWCHDGQILPPIRFIPILEQTHAICDLDFYMLEHVCQDMQRWMQEGKEVVKTSVNFSRRHMGSETLVENILQVIDKYNVPHEYIEIELTETTTDVEFRDLRTVVSGLQLHGVSTAVDDFGVGYSSLNLIRELPWDVLKIDKSFLPQDNDSSEKKLMFKYLIAMAQNMGLECIVEGVETLEQVRMLKENHCYLAQGFYFDKPLPVEEFENRLL